MIAAIMIPVSVMPSGALTDSDVCHSSRFAGTWSAWVGDTILANSRRPVSTAAAKGLDHLFAGHLVDVSAPSSNEVTKEIPNMSDHDSHGHIQLQYQPSLPLRNGKVCVWLFLSTEIMFFAALIGAYIVLRFGASSWPTPHDVHLSEPIGAFNTFVLICSSVTIVLCLEAARANKTGSSEILDGRDVVAGNCVSGRQGFRIQSKI